MTCEGCGFEGIGPNFPASSYTQPALQLRGAAAQELAGSVRRDRVGMQADHPRHGQVEQRREPSRFDVGWVSGCVFGHESLLRNQS